MTNVKAMVKGAWEKGIRIESLNVLMLLAIGSMAILALRANFDLEKEYGEVTKRQDIYERCVSNTLILREVSDNLTVQSMRFVYTGNPDYVQAYFEGVQSERREQALTGMEATREDLEILSMAMQHASDMMDMEVHAMKLVILAKELDASAFPESVINYSLPAEEISLTKEEQYELAFNMVMGKDYNDKKESFYNCIEAFQQSVFFHLEETVTDASDNVKVLITRQQILMGLLMIVILLVAWILYTQVVVILKKYVDCIVTNKPLNGKGVYELRYLAITYNDNTAKRLENVRKLQHRADYDALTGVINRGAFENYIAEAMLESAHFRGAFAIVDIDNFKHVNDTYGHDMGDEVLKEVATTLKDSFRNDDVVARFGGDEFTAWFWNVTEENSDYIQERIADINNRLLHPKNGLPPVSVSVGIAFYEKGDGFIPLYKKADRALYQVKENGRNGSRIYQREEDEDEIELDFEAEGIF